MGEGSDLSDAANVVTRTLWGLKRSSEGPILSSSIKRAILRKDPTFAESDYGFRTWGELMRHLESKGAFEMRDGTSEGDPMVEIPTEAEGEGDAFSLLRDVVADAEKASGAPFLSGLKDQLRRRKPGFSEKTFGYGGFLQFVKAARAKGFVDLKWEDESEDYLVTSK